MLSVVFSSKKKRVKIDVNGLVQGVGFRPFVYKLAQKYGLSGYILNNGSGVSIELEGVKENIDSFFSILYKNPPPLAKIDTAYVYDIEAKNETSFEILHSQKSEITTRVSPDMALCDECMLEMYDKTNRRYLYPFINCTNCGPRYSIINSLPYDRAKTSMKKFKMCETCNSEYNDISNRRYHAQPISCYDCGPKVSFIDAKNIENNLLKSFDKTVTFLNKDKIIALKGIGGFHLICNATSDNAVRKLRINKHRPIKPLAVMFKDIKEIEKVAIVSKEDRKLLLSKERPIVIVTKKKSDILSDLIAPDLDRLGVFLAYTPLHFLLLDRLNYPIVATSANLSDEPIIKEQEDIVKKLSCTTDAILTYDREIVNSCDDSLVTTLDEKTIFLRLARGYTPQSTYFKERTKKKILAVGANQKNTLSLCFENYIVTSPHLGDLNSINSFEYFLNTLETFKELYNFKADIIVCDKHPKYETTKWAKRYVDNMKNVELIELQHHYAHLLSCMAEYHLSGRVLAFCFDGTGYGDDGSLWGGEVLIANEHFYERKYHFKQMTLLGGEKAIENPRRVALALLFEIYTLDELEQLKHPLVESFTQEERKILYKMFLDSINSIQTSSVGRLFDAIFALSGNYKVISYEGEAGLGVEVLATESSTTEVYPYEVLEGIIDYKEMIREIIKNPKDISIKFINTLVNIIVDISHKHPKLPVVLVGGVFQNKLLCKKISYIFNKSGQEYYIQNSTVVNDGSISVGQAFYALNNR